MSHPFFLLLGIIITFGIMGPAAAFALGGAFTRMYVTLEGEDFLLIHFLLADYNCYYCYYFRMIS